MHIAVFTDYYLPTLGGVQTSIKAQKDTLEAAGHQVTVFCPLHEPSGDPTVVQLPTSKVIKPDNYPYTWSPERAKQFAQDYVERIEPVDVVHVHSEMAAAAAGVHLARSRGLPLVQTMHGRVDVYTQCVLPFPAATSVLLSWLYNRNNPVRPVTLRDAPYTRTALARRMWKLMVNQANYADHVIVPSHHFAHKLQYQGVNKPLTVLSNGLESTLLSQLRAIKPREYAGGDTEFRIMWCGRVSQEKRPIDFLRAIRQLPENVVVNMYGSGPAMKSVRRYITRHRLSGRVTLHGPVPQQTVLTAMQEHHLFASTSYDFDNQPMVLLEAHAAGTPVLLCDPDLTEVVPPEGTVLTATPDSQSIAAAVRELMAHPTRVREMSDYLLKSCDSTLQQPLTEQLLGVYESVLQPSA